MKSKWLRQNQTTLTNRLLNKLLKQIMVKNSFVCSEENGNIIIFLLNQKPILPLLTLLVFIHLTKNRLNVSLEIPDWELDPKLNDQITWTQWSSDRWIGKF